MTTDDPSSTPFIDLPKNALVKKHSNFRKPLRIKTHNICDGPKIIPTQPRMQTKGMVHDNNKKKQLVPCSHTYTPLKNKN